MSGPGFPPRERGAYGWFLTVPTRWMDNDTYGHVNNVVFYSWVDTAVNRYLIDEGGLDIECGPAIGIVVESACRYFAPIAYPQSVEAGVRVGRLGRSSVGWEVGLFAAGDAEAAASARFVHVFVDRESRRPEPIPEPVRAALARIEAPA